MPCRGKRVGFTYSQRDEYLKSKGYASYTAYLASRKWQRFRGEVLKDAVCACCGAPATEAHHFSYTPDNLDCKSVVGLFALCGACHHAVEFDGERKRSVEESQDAFLAATGRRLLERGTTEKNPRKPLGNWQDNIDDHVGGLAGVKNSAKCAQYQRNWTRSEFERYVDWLLDRYPHLRRGWDGK